MNGIIANLFELWGLAFIAPDFSKYMYKGGLYYGVFLVVFILPLIVWLIYYKPLDNIKLASNTAWTIILVSITLLTGIFAYWYSYNGVLDYIYKHHIQKYQITYMDVFGCTLVACLWSLVSSMIWTFAFKPLSIKCRKVPF